jgi:hypothetical protein
MSEGKIGQVLTGKIIQSAQQVMVQSIIDRNIYPGDAGAKVLLRMRYMRGIAIAGGSLERI